MKGLLFSKDGIIAKVRNQLAMKEKAAKAMEGLRGIVLAQAERAKKTMATARGVQEQSIIEREQDDPLEQDRSLSSWACSRSSSA